MGRCTWAEAAASKRLKPSSACFFVTMVNNNNNNNRVSGSSFMSDEEFVVIRLGGQNSSSQQPLDGYNISASTSSPLNHSTLSADRYFVWKYLVLEKKEFFNVCLWIIWFMARYLIFGRRWKNEKGPILQGWWNWGPVKPSGRVTHLDGWARWPTIF